MADHYDLNDFYNVERLSAVQARAAIEAYDITDKKVIEVTDKLTLLQIQSGIEFASAKRALQVILQCYKAKEKQNLARIGLTPRYD
ncbi:hypothetical protein HY486_03120 [Candidatus Woesearchaeota archaeon]|nr:hypothetical protein [Candidatus Woesearchaeota archaeon]